MGQSLSEPVTVKSTETFHNDTFLVGCSSMQGWRPQMEDASTVQLPFNNDPNSAFFAVFDGHGSRNFATYCSEELHKQIMADTQYVSGNYPCALKNGFMTLDHQLHTDSNLRFQYEPGGTTAVVVLIKDSTIFCANAGDSRAIACVQGKVQELSHDHKPMHPAEERRIFKAGGWVECNRVNGNLALSRAIGDFNFKKNCLLPPEEQIVTADPDIISYAIVEDHEFIVVACDGVWDVMSNKDVVDFIRTRIADHMSPSLICEALLDHCLAPDCHMGGLGCDNMTIILICFINKQPYPSLAQRCSKEPIKSNNSQNRQLHSWAHNRNCTLALVDNPQVHKEMEESLTIGSSPKPPNDTVSGASTDLDSAEMASLHNKHVNHKEKLQTQESSNGGFTSTDTESIESRSNSVDIISDSSESELCRGIERLLDSCHAIETTV